MEALPKTIVSLYPPTVINSVVSGKRYAIFGGMKVGSGWYEVPADFTIEDARKHWKKMTFENSTNVKDNTWEVANSKGNGFYTVSVVDNVWSCSCVGFTYHRDCKHIKQKKNDSGTNSNVSRKKLQKSRRS